MARPMSAEELKGNMRRAIDTYPYGKTDPVTEAQKRKVALTLNEIFDSEDDPDSFRRTAIRHLTGKESLTKLTKAEASCLIEWLGGDETHVKVEAYRLILLDGEEKGQLSLL